MNISVVIPAYNVESWISSAVSSVLAQQPAPHEVIVVDDGSTDTTAAVVPGLGDKVRLISQANAGPAAARNRGIEAATGDVLYLLDADDEALPGAFAEILKAFEADPEAGAVSGNFVQCASNGDRQVAWPNHPGKVVLRRSDARALLLDNHLSANSAFRADVLKRHMFREDLELRGCEDLDLWLRLVLDEVPIVTLAKPLCLYRVTRVGALTSEVLVMRRRRSFLFRELLHDPRLHPREKLVVVYQCLRSAVGIVAARASSSRGSTGPSERERLTVLQVAMNEPGGGRVHIRELQEGLRDHLDSHVLELARSSPAKPRTWFRSRTAMKRMIKEHKPDVIHAHGVRAAALALTARCHAKRVVTIHGLHSLRRSRGLPALLSTALNRAVLGRMRRILVLSASDLDRLLKMGITPGKTQAIRTSIRRPAVMERDSARRSLGLAKGAFVVLWLGRFVREKDPITFVAATRELKDEDVTAIMPGDGPLMPEVTTAIRRSDLRETVLLPGWLSDPSVAFAAADVFVTTSLWEGFPLAALEAASAGLPLIATDVAGNRDLVSCGVTARLIPPRDPGRLACELKRLRNQPYPTTREAADSWVAKEFSRKHLTEDVLHAYKAALDGAKASSADLQTSDKRVGASGTQSEMPWAG